MDVLFNYQFEAFFLSGAASFFFGVLTYIKSRQDLALSLQRQKPFKEDAEKKLVDLPTEKAFFSGFDEPSISMQVLESAEADSDFEAMYENSLSTIDAIKERKKG